MKVFEEETEIKGIANKGSFLPSILSGFAKNVVRLQDVINDADERDSDDKPEVDEDERDEDDDSNYQRMPQTASFKISKPSILEGLRNYSPCSKSFAVF